MLQDLIRFDTTNPPGNEADCVAYANQLLIAAGFQTVLLGCHPDRPNLITRLSGRGDAPPLLLHGHVDVVTTAGQKWTYPPFEGTVADGCVWGRGALDMKSGVAMMLAALLRAKAEGFVPAGDVVLAILCDEEAGSDYGAKYLVENHSEHFRGVRYAIGEGGGFSRLHWEEKTLSHHGDGEAALHHEGSGTWSGRSRIDAGSWRRDGQVGQSTSEAGSAPSAGACHAGRTSECRSHGTGAVIPFKLGSPADS